MSAKNFKRSDILSESIVEFRNGERRFVIFVNDHPYTPILVNPNNHTWDYLDSWDSVTLTHHTDSLKDIMVVYGLVSEKQGYGYAMDVNHIKPRPVVWRRIVAKKMTVAEIEAALGHAVEIVSEGE